MTLARKEAGEAFIPDVEEFNTIIDATNLVMGEKFPDDNQFNPNAGDADLVMIKNNTGSNLAEFSIVKIGEVVITPDKNEADFKYETPLFYGEEIDDADNTFVVIQEPIEKDKIGYAKITGVTIAKITVSSETDKYAVLDTLTKKLKTATSGITKILWRQTGTGEKWAVILLGSGSAGSTYNGMFKIIADPDDATKIKVIDGNNPDSANCGTVIAGSTTNTIPVQSFAGTSYIWEKTVYDPDAETYTSTLISGAAPQSGDYTHLVFIGSANNQSWDGDAINLSEFNIWVS